MAEKKIKRKLANELFTALGFDNPSEKTDTQVESVLNKLSSKIDLEAEEVITLNPKMKALFFELVEAEGEIVVEETLNSPIPKSAVKKVEKKVERDVKKKRIPAVVKASTKEKHPGILASIIVMLKEASKSSPITKDQILAKLKKAFPDRESDPGTGMYITVHSQVPYRLGRDKGIVLNGDSEKGFWFSKQDQSLINKTKTDPGVHVGKNEIVVLDKSKKKKKKKKAVK